MTFDSFRRAAGSLLRRAGVIDERQGRLFGDEGQALAREDATDVETSPRDTTPTTSTKAAPPAKDVPGEAIYRHPQATRQLRLAGCDVAYAFARVRRRSIGMVVGPEGLSVRAPRWVSLREVEAALHERAAWILQHLAGQRERSLRARESQAQWCDGGTLRVLGEPVRLVLDASISGCVPSWAFAVPPHGATLRVGLPPSSPSPTCTSASDTLRNTIEAWLQAQASVLFAQRCAHFAPLLGVQVRRISLSGARTRWGSAGVDGSIRLNWRLMHHTMEGVDYVVVHELAHLRHMNHGAAFWRLVASVLPDHRAARKRLRDDAVDSID